MKEEIQEIHISDKNGPKYAYVALDSLLVKKKTHVFVYESTPVRFHAYACTLSKKLEHVYHGATCGTTKQPA